jgi:ribosomal protein S18 acetylase RimI-like enzyme
VYLVHDLENLPPLEIPDGYHATSVTPGAEMDFQKVVTRSFREASYADWYRRIQDDPEYDPRNFLMIRKGEIPVAVVVAWQRTFEGEKVGQLHVLAVDPDFRGQGLAQAMMLLCLIRSRERGFKRMVIVTEDDFIPAISLYLSYGAKPVYFNWFHRRRWRRILRNTRSRARSHR